MYFYSNKMKDLSMTLELICLGLKKLLMKGEILLCTVNTFKSVHPQAFPSTDLLIQFS